MVKTEGRSGDRSMDLPISGEPGIQAFRGCPVPWICDTHAITHLKKLPLYEVPQKSGGQRTARRVQDDIAQLRMRRITMLDIAPSKPATTSNYAGRSPNGEEDADLTGESGKAIRAADFQEGDQSHPEATREIPFHAMRAHRKSRAFRAEFDIMYKSSAISGRISTVVFVVRASGHRCLGIYHTN